MQPLVNSAKGTLKAAGDVLSVVGDLNFLVVEAAVDISNKVELSKKSSNLIHDWWESVHSTTADSGGSKSLIGRP